MATALSPEIEKIIGQKIATGRYASADDVISAALKALDIEDATIAAIREGHEDYLAGRVYPLEESNVRFAEKYGFPPGQ